MGYGQQPMPPPGFGGREWFPSITYGPVLKRHAAAARPPFPPGQGFPPMMPPGGPPFPPGGMPPPGMNGPGFGGMSLPFLSPCQSSKSQQFVQQVLLRSHPTVALLAALVFPHSHPTRTAALGFHREQVRHRQIQTQANQLLQLFTPIDCGC